MTKELRGPILGVTIAIVINAAMNAAGLSSLSFASLFPLMLIFWFIQRLPRKSMGFALGGVATLCFSATAPFGVQAARAAGATFDELTALVDKMETAPL